jgi:hypothetical protein
MPTENKVAFHWRPDPPADREAWEAVARTFLEDPGRAPGVFDVHFTQVGTSWAVRVVHSPVQIQGSSGEPLDYSGKLVETLVAAGLPALL